MTNIALYCTRGKRVLARSCVVGVAVFLAASTVFGQAAARLTVFSDFRPSGVSADGSVLCGTHVINGGTSQSAAYWTPLATVDIPDLISVTAVSPDGSTFAGSVGNSPYKPATWTSSGGLVNLGELPGAVVSYYFHTPCAVSDAGLVTGTAYETRSMATNEHWMAFQGTKDSGLAGLGTMTQRNSNATGASADGSVVVGYTTNFFGSAGSAFRWTQATGMTDLGFLSTSHRTASASAVSADGSVVVGSSNIYDPWYGLYYPVAFRWTEATGMVSLGLVSGTNPNWDYYAGSVSGDGSVILGTGWSPNESIWGHVPFIWTAEQGIRDLREVLILDYGLDRTLVYDTITRGHPGTISADGKTIVCTDPSVGATWMVQLVAPEPSALAYWDGQGDGNWTEINTVNGDSRWVREDGEPFLGHPYRQSTHAVIRTNRVTLSEDLSIGRLSAESGTLSLAENTALDLKGQAEFAVGASLVLGTSASINVGAGTGRFDRITGGDVATIRGTASITGEISMGNPLGTLAVDGDLMLTETATHVVDLGGAANDVLAVTNNLTICSGSTLVIRADGPIRDPYNGRSWGDMKRTVLTAASISNTFTNIPQFGQYLGAGVWFGDANGSGVSYLADKQGLNVVSVAVFQAAPGDVDGNRMVDVPDIQNLLKIGKFNAREPALWTEGDFSDDGLFTSLDVQMILAANLFNKGRYDVLAANAEVEPASVLMRLTPGGLVIDTQGAVINGYVLSSEAGLLTGEAAENLGVFQVDRDTEISGQMFFALSGEHLLGQVTGEGLSAEQLAGDLKLSYTVAGQAGVYEATLVVPEPAALGLLLSGLMAFTTKRMLRRRR